MEHTFRLDLAALTSFELAVVKLNTEGVCVFANAAAEQLLGSPTAIGWSLGDLFPVKEEIEVVQAELQKRLQGQASSYPTTFTRPSDQQKIPVSIFAFPVLEDDGSIAGSMAIVSDLRLPFARHAMHEAIESYRSSHQILAAVASQLRTLVPFDEFRVSALSRGRKHLQQVFSTDSAAAEKYPFKWWPLPEFLLKTLDEESARIIDMAEMFAQPEYAEMAKRDPATKAYLESGVRYSLSVPVLSGDRIVAFVGLDTRSPTPFSAEDLALCDKLPIAEAVKMALHHEEASTLRACLDLIRDMGCAGAAVGDVAQVLVDSLARQFGWDHVAVFQYDEDKDAFLVLSQASARGCKIDGEAPSMWQNGIVARAFREQRVVNVPNVGPGKPGSEAYLKGVAGMVSELAIPIPGERPRWVLNVESALEGAFADEEIELLKPVLTEAGHILDRLSLLEMRSAVLTAVNDAVIETNQRGLIRRINPAGLFLLGASQETELLGQPLQAYISDPALGALLVGADRFSRREVELLRADGRAVPALLSGAHLPEGLGGRVFIASDLTYQREMERSGILKDVFRHASLECRVPLALASGWLGQMAGQTDELAPAIDRVLQQIRKADMPLERLLRLADMTPGASEAAQPVNLKGILDEVLAQFPESERSNVEVMPLSPDPVFVWGSPEDYRFCLEASLSFALRTKPQNKQVKVQMNVDGGSATLLMSGDWAPVLGTEPTPAIRQRWRRTAASDLALAEDVIEGIVGRANGNFSSVLDDQLRLSIELPLARGA